MERTSSWRIAFVATLILIGCHTPSYDEIFGTWEFRAGERTVCLDVNRDGSYYEKISKSGKTELENSGKWVREPERDGEKLITFENYRMLSDNGEKIGEPSYWPIYPEWRTWSGKFMLKLSQDENLGYVKVDKPCR